jgi:predicted TIM-barrel fold metal-dependent hydrolase
MNHKQSVEEKSSQKFPVIDVHVHYQDRPGFLDELLQICDKCGVDKICLNGGGREWGQKNNDEVEIAFRTCPQRIIGFGFIKLGKDKPELVDDLFHRGFKGLKTQNPRAPYDDKSFWDFYERAQRYGMPILFHVGMGARGAEPGGTSSSYMRPVLLDTIARNFPDLKIIAAHLGFPWCAETAMLTMIHPNVYFDLAGVDRTEAVYPSVLNIREHLLWHKNGLSKLMFGTEGGPEYLEMVKREYEQLLDRHQIDPSIQQRVMGLNVLRLLCL